MLPNPAVAKAQANGLASSASLDSHNEAGTAGNYCGAPASHEMDDQLDGKDGDSGPSGKRRRIWAACEPCRKRKSRCDGQNPCSGCIAIVKASYGTQPVSPGASTSAASSPKSMRFRSNSQADLLAWAREVCVFDWNRKPRGPKRKKKAQATGAEDGIGMGAPRTQASAGRAYVAAQQHRKGSTEDVGSASHSQVPSVDTFSFAPPHAGSLSFGSMLSPNSFNESSKSGGQPSLENNFNFPPNPDAVKPHFLHRDSGGSTGTVETIYSEPSSQSSLQKNADSQGWQGRDMAGPSNWVQQYHGTDNFPQLKTMATIANLRENGSSSSSTATANRPTGPSGSVLINLPYSLHHRSSSHSSHRPSTVASGASSDGKSRVDESPRVSHASMGLVVATGSPRSEGSANYFNQAIAFSSPSSNSQDRYMDQSMLINRLRPYYSDTDRPFVAIAIAQFEGFDSLEKLVPSRYLFGQASSTPYPEPPAHLLLALLALLGHRALLLPDNMNIEDLDLQAGDAVLRCANDYGRLEGENRNQMLHFARRSWSLGHGLMLQKIKAGHVDHRLLQTGVLLDLGATEDGISSKTMTNLKLWLFRLVYCWRLHQMDAKGDLTDPWEGAEVMKRALEITNEVEEDQEWSPLPRVTDARGMTTDPVELEAVRRAVQAIAVSAYWIQTADMQLPRFDLYTMEVEWAAADDFIHHSSNWTPKVHPASNGFLQQTRHLVFRLYGRVTRLLHTPLLEICTGRSLEPDLQQALTEMETQLDWLKGRIGYVTYEGPEMPLRVATFVHSRICDLLMYRLFLAIQTFYAVFVVKTAAKPDPSLRIASTMIPTDERRTNFERIAGDHTGVPSDEPQVDDNGLGLISRPQFTRHPMKACLAALWEIGAIANRLLFLHRARDAALAPTIEEGKDATRVSPRGQKVGTATGKTMDASLRSLRWPRHMRIFAQHAFAMAAEVHAAGSMWQRTMEDETDNPSWIQPPSFDALPVFEQGEVEQGLWEIGDTLTELLEAIGKTGSTHATLTAQMTRKYRQERYEWAAQHSGSTR